MAENPKFEFKGNFRGVYVKRWHDLEFMSLPPKVKLLLFNLETGPNSNLPRVFPLYHEPIEKQTGLSPQEVREGLKLLIDAGWVVVEDGLIWVKNGLRDDANVSLKNQSHVTAIKRIIAGLPQSSLIKQFLEYYRIP